MAKEESIEKKTKELREKVTSLTKAFFVEMAKLDCEQLVVINHPLFNDNMFIGMHTSKLGSIKILETIKLKIAEALFDGKHFTKESAKEVAARMGRKGDRSFEEILSDLAKGKP